MVGGGGLGALGDLPNIAKHPPALELRQKRSFVAGRIQQALEDFVDGQGILDRVQPADHAKCCRERLGLDRVKPFR